MHCGEISFLLIIILGHVAGKENLMVIFERESVTYANDKYITVHEHVMKRANRSSPYTYKFNATILQPWYNNVTIELKGYENKNNEYKESILHFTYQICDLYEKPNFILKLAKKTGNLPEKCPMVGNLYVDNFYTPGDELPPFLPKSKWMLQAQAYTTKRKVKIIEFAIYFEITLAVKKNKKSSKKNNKNKARN